VKNILFALLGLLLALSAASSHAAGFAGVREGRIVGPDGQALRLRGIGLGNWLVPEGYMFCFSTAVAPRQISEVFEELVGPAYARSFWLKFRDAYIRKEDLSYLKSLGFNLVRVPFNAKLLNPESYPAYWDEAEFKRLDDVVSWAREAGLWVVLDMHAAHGGQTGDNIDDSTGTPWLFESQESQDRVVEVWRRVAARFKGETAVLGYELLNEPISSSPDVQRYGSMLEPLYRRIVAAIRESDTEHLVILSGTQSGGNLSVLGAPFDKRSVYTFHHYWAPPEEGMKGAKDFRARHKVPLWMGESGENTDEWISSFRTILEKNDIEWAFWPYKKMESQWTTSVLRFARPAHWDEIQRYADDRGGSYAQKRAARPSIAHAREALDSLLKNVRLENCRMNRGYVSALGLNPVDVPKSE
jgi:hypothetical protein